MWYGPKSPSSSGPMASGQGSCTRSQETGKNFRFSTSTCKSTVSPGNPRLKCGRRRYTISSSACWRHQYATARMTPIIVGMAISKGSRTTTPMTKIMPRKGTHRRGSKSALHRDRDRGDDIGDQFFGGSAPQFSHGGNHQAVRQHMRRHKLDIIRNHKIAVLDPGPGLGSLV